MTPPRKILLVAGGTGGHIWPAIAFGKWAATAHPAVEVRYVCGSREIEREIYAAAAIAPLFLSMDGSPAGASRGLAWKRSLALMRSVFAAGKILRREVPDVCILFGGYLSAPFLLRAWMRNTPLLIHEQNAYAGRVTRGAARLGVRVATGWPVCDPLKPGRYRHIGVPVRCFSPMGRAEAWTRLGLPDVPPAGPIVSVMTGSLGSGTLSGAMEALAENPCFATACFLVVHPEVDGPVKKGDNLFYVPRRWDPAPLYGAADALVVRGGGSTLTEAVLSGLPTVVVPWRGAAGDHQMKNARAAAQAHSVAIWDEACETVDDLAGKLCDILRSFVHGKKCEVKKMYNREKRICEALWDYSLES